MQPIRPAISRTQTASRADFDIPTSGTSVTDNRVKGLSNGTEYCFIVANKDIAGNVFYYLPTVATNSPSGTTFLDPNIVCATPDTVVGLLDDKSCFIATAAFGSQMAPEVETFRKFRNHFLLTNSWGRGFVKTYYKLSPPLADFIARHDTLRAAARGVLWPLLLFAKLSLEWGILWTALAAAILTMLLLEAFRPPARSSSAEENFMTSFLKTFFIFGGICFSLQTHAQTISNDPMDDYPKIEESAPQEPPYTLAPGEVNEFENADKQPAEILNRA